MLEQEEARFNDAGGLELEADAPSSHRGRPDLARERPKPLYEKLIPEYNQK